MLMKKMEKNRNSIQGPFLAISTIHNFYSGKKFNSVKSSRLLPSRSIWKRKLGRLVQWEHGFQDIRNQYYSVVIPIVQQLTGSLFFLGCRQPLSRINEAHLRQQSNNQKDVKPRLTIDGTYKFFLVLGLWEATNHITQIRENNRQNVI